MLFVHFALPPESLAPHVPFPLDTHEGSAFVSLVFFRLERMRPPGTGTIGRWLTRPISDHPFLNVRTYVRGPAGPGIHFLTEWIPNRLSVPIGPRVYGLPYRFARFRGALGESSHVGEVQVTDPALEAGLHLSIPACEAPLMSAAAGSRDDFLLERYTAYTHHQGVSRYFRVRHDAWRWIRPAWLRSDTDLVRRAFPWFAGASYAGAHRSPGVFGVRMGRPHRVGAAPIGIALPDCAQVRA